MDAAEPGDPGRVRSLPQPIAAKARRMLAETKEARNTSDTPEKKNRAIVRTIARVDSCI
jgi:hypothetical protein